MTARFCSSCGAAVNPSAQFCASCGSPAGAPTVVQQSVVPGPGVSGIGRPTGPSGAAAGPPPRVSLTKAGGSAAVPPPGSLSGAAATGSPWKPVPSGPAASEAPTEPPRAPWVRRLDESTPPTRRRHGVLPWLAVAAAVAVVAVIAVFVSSRDSTSDVAAPADPSAATSPQLDAPPTATSPSSSEPSTDVPSRTPSPTVPASPAQSSGDLGLTTPISRPACNGQWVVFLGAATTPGRYAADIDQLLGTHAGAEYLLTEGSCSSLRQRLDDGARIYAAYVGYFADQSTACTARDRIGGGAYVKRLDNTTPAEQLWQC